ncbi:MAG TPA: DM13 domain-containing protein [Jatrophihabitans sp.]
MLGIGRFVRRHRWLTATVTICCTALAVFVFVYFAPQDLFINTSVNEPFPTASAAFARPVDAPNASPSRMSPTGRSSVLARGAFRSGEHDTTGTVLLVALADGRVFVRIEGLDTSNGPDVRIWLSAAGYRAPDDAVHDAAHVDVGGLKANHGNQNYLVPAGTDLSAYHSVAIWCRRFEVVFGAAPLA